MKNKDEEPKEYFERNMLFVIILTIIAVGIDYLAIYKLINTNPWGTLIGVPGITLTLQALWLLVNPYAIVYEDRFEIKQSLLSHKQFYYLDAKSVNNKKSNYITIVYNDNDEENISILGIKNAHKALFLKKLEDMIALSIKNRGF